MTEAQRPPQPPGGPPYPPLGSYPPPGGPPYPPPGQGPGSGSAFGALPRVPQRLHPLSPVVRLGRSVLAIAFILFGVSSQGPHNFVVDYIVVGFVVVSGFISWYVTTWSIDGDTLQVHSGLIRRNTVRVPLSRVQAVDLVEPLAARILGLAEVRARTAGGSGGDARLMYLKQEDAYRVRATLLALAHGLPDSTPPPQEQPLLRVSNGRLVGSILLTGGAFGTLIGLALFIGLRLAGGLGDAVVGASSGTFVYFVSFAQQAVRRVAGEWDFEVAEAPDGLRIRCGFASRVAETIPYGRIQAIRMVEPLWWRPLSWYRLELHLAGSVKREGKQPRSGIRRALLPVGRRADMELLLGRVLAAHTTAVTKPPRKAMLRAPFSYHFLAAGRNEEVSVAVTGRVCRLTEWVPLAKVQSVRSVQGPLQRLFGLESVHLDVAGHRAGVGWLDRSAAEAQELMAAFPISCELARDRESSQDRAARAARSAVRASAPPFVGPPPAPPDLVRLPGPQAGFGSADPA